MISTRIQKKIEDIFSLDIRSLALFRVAMAVNLLWDLAVRATSMSAFYSDAGILPRATLLTQNRNPWMWSFHLMGGTVFAETILFSLAALFACGLLVGYRTRFMTLASWLFLCSMHSRMPYLQNSGDVYVRLSLLWSIFLPLGACWSVDRELHSGAEEIPTRVYNGGTVALILQTVLVYMMTAAFKFRGADWWGTGHAVYYTLNLEVFATPAAHALLMFPHLLTFLTYAVLFYELIGPLLLISPVATERVRTFVLLGFLLMQISFGLCLRVDPFPRVSMVELLPFFPLCFWNNLEPLLAKSRRAWKKSKLNLLGQRMSQILKKLPKRPLRARLSWAENVLALFLFVLASYRVISEFDPATVKLHPLYPTFQAVTNIAQLDQAWGMFAPHVARSTGWLVIPGKLKNGNIVDIYKDGAPLSWAPPPQVSTTFKSERWRKYLTGMIGTRREGFRDYSQYVCRVWNDAHPADEQLQSFDIVMMANTVLPNYQVEVPHPVKLWWARCPGQPIETIHDSNLPKHAKKRGRPQNLIMTAPFAP